MMRTILGFILLCSMPLAGCERPEKKPDEKTQAVLCVATYRIMLEYVADAGKPLLLKEKQKMEARVLQYFGDQSEAEIANARQALAQHLDKLRRETGPGAPKAQLGLRFAHCAQLP